MIFLSQLAMFSENFEVSWKLKEWFLENTNVKFPLVSFTYKSVYFGRTQKYGVLSYVLHGKHTEVLGMILCV